MIDPRDLRMSHTVCDYAAPSGQTIYSRPDHRQGRIDGQPQEAA
jgi:hypothetical protein